MYKKNGYYYILMPSGGVEDGWQSCLRSRSVYGPYEYKIVMHQGNSAVNGPHQGGWVTSSDGRDWFIHFQDVIELGRIVHLQLCVLQMDGRSLVRIKMGMELGNQWKAGICQKRICRHMPLPSRMILRKNIWDFNGSGRLIQTVLTIH